MKTTEKRPTCISIGPYGATEAEKSYRRDLEIVLKEVFETTHDYRPFYWVTKIDMASDIFSALIDSDLVVADLRGLNPNVMYELGLRHAFNKPVLHLIDSQTEAPWDIDKNYMVQYTIPLQLSHKDALVEDIKDRLSKIDMIDKKTGSFNTFHSQYKNVASVAHFQGAADIKVVLEAMAARMDSMQRSIEVSNANSARNSRWESIVRDINPWGSPNHPPMTLSQLAGVEPHSAAAVARMAASGISGVANTVNLNGKNISDGNNNK